MFKFQFLSFGEKRNNKGNKLYCYNNGNIGACVRFSCVILCEMRKFFNNISVSVFYLRFSSPEMWYCFIHIHVCIKYTKHVYGVITSRNFLCIMLRATNKKLTQEFFLLFTLVLYYYLWWFLWFFAAHSIRSRSNSNFNYFRYSRCSLFLRLMQRASIGK